MQHRPYPEWTIRRLNTQLSAPSSIAELEEALAIEELAPAFKRSINSQLHNLQQAAKKCRLKTTALCPCQSSLSYEDCCRRFHSGNLFPETAEQLMRSRYSAFVLKNIPYIVQTTVPSQQTLLDEKALQDWANETQWLGLEIVKAETLTKTQSAVEFKAHFQGSEQPQVHHEYSLFVKI